MSSRREQELERALRDAAPVGFRDGFTDRVLARLGTDSIRVAETPGFDVMLQRQFVRVVPLLAAASLILALYGWWAGRDVSDSLLDATLNLPQASLATVYAPEMYYGAVGDN